jgi:hypothetical protein
MNYETTPEIEIAVANYFAPLQHVVVPNVSWGMFAYELDLIVLNDRSKYVTEVEIKVSRGDLKRDELKKHLHDSRMIRWLYFAMPQKLAGSIDLVPERAGILLVSPEGRVKVLRRPQQNKEAPRWNDADSFKLARLGCIRIWGLKRRLKVAQDKYLALRDQNMPKCSWRQSVCGHGPGVYRISCNGQEIHIDLEHPKLYKYCPNCGGKIEVDYPIYNRVTKDWDHTSIELTADLAKQYPD